MCKRWKVGWLAVFSVYMHERAMPSPPLHFAVHCSSILSCNGSILCSCICTLHYQPVRQDLRGSVGGVCQGHVHTNSITSTTGLLAWIDVPLACPADMYACCCPWLYTTGAAVGHSSTVWSVCFSPDGSRLASVSDDLTLRLWNITWTDQLPPTPHAALAANLSGYHKRTIFSVDWSKDNVLATGVCKLWN